MMIRSIAAVVLALWVSGFAMGAEPRVVLEESFTGELSKDWYWGLGTWKAENGVLRGFESGPRRHGPVKVRRQQMKDAIVECEFRLVGKATFAGIIFNGLQGRGHIVHLIMSKDHLRVMAHPKPGESLELISIPNKLTVGEWHHVKLEFKGESMTALVDDQQIAVTHACIGEQKHTFGLGGESGGPEGENAGALEFRALKVSEG